MKPRLLDLFCGAGGAAMGYHQAGFDVVGVDVEHQPNYPFEFVQADALDFLQDAIGQVWVSDFAAVHASPPCQAFSSMKVMHNAREHGDLLTPTRELLEATNLPYVIENVPGAPLRWPYLFCGTAFGLGVGNAQLRRHRLFESTFSMMVPPCQHCGTVVDVYGGHARNRARTIGVYGKGARDSRRKGDKGQPDFTADEAREAMGIDWMTINELSQAIPPAYTEHIGSYLLAHLKAERLAA